MGADESDVLCTCASTSVKAVGDSRSVGRVSAVEPVVSSGACKLMEEKLSAEQVSDTNLHIDSRSASVLIGRGQEKGGEILLGDHFELGVLASEVSSVVEIVSRVGSSAGCDAWKFGARSRIRPSRFFYDGDS